MSHAGDAEPDALMQYGYMKYPECYLTNTDLETLKKNVCFTKIANNVVVAEEKYLYEGGIFLKTNKKWKETNSSGTNNFQETNADNNYYYLEDKSRNMKLKIPKTIGWSYYTTSNAWIKLYYITKG